VSSGGADKTVKVWDAKTGKCESTLGVDAGTFGVQSVSFSPKGDVIAAGCSNGKIYLVDALAGEVKSTLAGHRYVPSLV
jgi:WD40 repeat protein